MKNNIRTIKAWGWLSGVLLSIIIFATSSFAQTNYAIVAVQRGSSNVVEISKDTGNNTFLFNLPFTADFNTCLDYNPADGFLYIAEGRIGGYADFYRVDLAANTATFVKTISGLLNNGPITSIGFTPSGDVYANCYVSGGGPVGLYFIQWTTGNVQSLGSSGFHAMLGGDYDSTRNVYWASDESYGKVYQLSTANGAILWTSTSTWASGNFGPDFLGSVNMTPNGDILICAGDNSGNVDRILQLNASTGLWTTNLTINVNTTLRFATVPIFPKVNLIKAVTVNFSNLSIGTNYQLQVSTDLNSWTNVATPFTATNSFMTCSNYWNVSDWNQLFFRLQ